MAGSFLLQVRHIYKTTQHGGLISTEAMLRLHKPQNDYFIRKKKGGQPKSRLLVKDDGMVVGNSH